tara:strand:- start:1663 stop:2211 length:549 start_codon:yes stop_codon:yes gene_type:complete
LACRGEAAQRGLTVIESYTDVTFGSHAAGPALRRLIDGAASGTFDVVICVSLDRLSRQNNAIENIRAVLASNGVTLVTCEPEDAALVTTRLKELIANATRDDRRARARRAIAEKTRETSITGQRPHGRAPRDQAHAQANKIDRVQAGAIRTVYESSAKGGPAAAIVNPLHTMAIPLPPRKEQ